MREPGILPMLVVSAASIFSAVVCGHCAGSSASTSAGASPCARFGSEPMQRSRAPDSRCSTIANCCVLSTRQVAPGSAPMNAIAWSKAIRA